MFSCCFLQPCEDDDFITLLKTHTR